MIFGAGRGKCVVRGVVGGLRMLERQYLRKSIDGFVAEGGLKFFGCYIYVRYEEVVDRYAATTCIV
jgi:hypothetical protein